MKSLWKRKIKILKASQKQLTWYKVRVILTWVLGDVLPLVHLLLKVGLVHCLHKEMVMLEALSQDICMHNMAIGNKHKQEIRGWLTLHKEKEASPFQIKMLSERCHVLLARYLENLKHLVLALSH